MYSLISNAVSELPVVFCNDIHVNNLENKLFTLKVGYLIVSKSLYFLLYVCKHLMSDSSYMGILSLKNFYSKILLNGELKKITEQYSLSATRKSLCAEKKRKKKK